MSLRCRQGLISTVLLTAAAAQEDLLSHKSLLFDPVSGSGVETLERKVIYENLKVNDVEVEIEQRFTHRNPFSLPHISRNQQWTPKSTSPEEEIKGKKSPLVPGKEELWDALYALYSNAWANASHMVKAEATYVDRAAIMSMQVTPGDLQMTFTNGLYPDATRDAAQHKKKGVPPPQCFVVVSDDRLGGHLFSHGTGQEEMLLLQFPELVHILDNQPAYLASKQEGLLRLSTHDDEKGRPSVITMGPFVRPGPPIGKHIQKKVGSAKETEAKKTARAKLAEAYETAAQNKASSSKLQNICQVLRKQAELLPLTVCEAANHVTDTATPKASESHLIFVNGQDFSYRNTNYGAYTVEEVEFLAEKIFAAFGAAKRVGCKSVVSGEIGVPKMGGSRAIGMLMQGVMSAVWKLPVEYYGPGAPVLNEFKSQAKRLKAKLDLRTLLKHMATAKDKASQPFFQHLPADVGRWDIEKLIPGNVKDWLKAALMEISKGEL